MYNTQRPPNTHTNQKQTNKPVFFQLRSLQKNPFGEKESPTQYSTPPTCWRETLSVFTTKKFFTRIGNEGL